MSNFLFDDNQSLSQLARTFDPKHNTSKNGKKKGGKIYAITPRPCSNSLTINKQTTKPMSTTSSEPRLLRSKTHREFRKRQRSKKRNASPSKSRSRERTNSPGSGSAPWTETRDLCCWSKMEIAEWLQLNWYTSNSSKNLSKLSAYINIIKREKKFDGKNLAKLKDRDLGILAHKHLKLQKTDRDYKIFMNRMHALQAQYSHSHSPSSRPSSRSASRKRTKQPRQEHAVKSRARSNTLPHQTDNERHTTSKSGEHEDVDQSGMEPNLTRSSSNQHPTRNHQAKPEASSNQDMVARKKWSSAESPFASENRSRARLRLQHVSENKELSATPKRSKKKMKKTRFAHDTPCVAGNMHEAATRAKARQQGKHHKEAASSMRGHRKKTAPQPHRLLHGESTPHRYKGGRKDERGLTIHFNSLHSSAASKLNNHDNREHAKLPSNTSVHKQPKRTQKQMRIKRKRSVSSTSLMLSESNQSKKGNVAAVVIPCSARTRDRERGKARHRGRKKKKKGKARHSSPKSCPPTDDESHYGFHQRRELVVLAKEEMDEGGLNTTEEQEEEKTVHEEANNKVLQFSVTSPAGSPTRAPLFRMHSKYDGVTAAELLQLISRGHSDEIDTDYDTDANDIADHDFDDYPSETPSPKHPETYISRLQLLSSSNSANNSNLSNISVSSVELTCTESNDSATSSNTKQKQQKAVTAANSVNHSNSKLNSKQNSKKQYQPTHFRFSDSDISDYEQSSSESSDDGLYNKKIEKAKTCRIRVDSEEHDEPPVTDLSLSLSLHGNDQPHRHRHHHDSKHKTIVIPSIFSIGDSCSDVVLSPNAKMPETDGLLLDAMVHYSITDESSDEEANDSNNDIRESTNRIIEYALQNSPTLPMDHPRNNAEAGVPASAPMLLQLSCSSTKLAVLDDLTEFVNDADLDMD